MIETLKIILPLLALIPLGFMLRPVFQLAVSMYRAENASLAVKLIIAVPPILATAIAVFGTALLFSDFWFGTTYLQMKL